MVCPSDALPRSQSLLVLDGFFRAAVDQQVANVGHVVADGVVKGRVAKFVLSVDVCPLLDQEVADVEAAELGSYGEQGVSVNVHDVHAEHVSLEVSLDDLDLVELDRSEHLVSLLLFDECFVLILFLDALLWLFQLQEGLDDFGARNLILYQVKLPDGCHRCYLQHRERLREFAPHGLAQSRGWELFPHSFFLACVFVLLACCLRWLLLRVYFFLLHGKYLA